MQNSETNSANSANQTTGTPKAVDTPARTMPGRKIDATCIAEMAKLVAKMLTESEACRRLGIKPRTWFDFKSRAGRTQHFADMVEAYRAQRIEQLIDRIENSADGVGLKFPDWRAALALLKITDQKRFGDGVAVEVTASMSPVVTIAGGEDNLRRLVGMFAEQARAEQTQVQCQAAPKQIADAVEVKAEKQP